jgi:hypothetical protein
LARSCAYVATEPILGRRGNRGKPQIPGIERRRIRG